jgi:hypothetical protein
MRSATHLRTTSADGRHVGDVELKPSSPNLFDEYPERALYNTFLGIKYPRPSPYEKDGR